MPNRTADEQVRLIREYVQQHLTERISVRSIARSLGRNASYLNTFYTEQTGECITVYIRRCKVRRAERLLRETDRSLAEICASLGFFDQSHFSRTFKAQTGMTPGAYRKM